MRNGGFLIALLALAVGTPVLAAAPPVIPAPVETTAGEGAVTIAEGAVLLVPPGDGAARFAAEQAADLVRRTRGIGLRVTDQPATALGTVIRFERAADAPVAEAEGYTLSVTPDGLVVQARDDAGLFYGAMTLAQLLSPDDHFGQAVRVPAQTIRDWPRFAWRGVMIDSARHFLPVEAIRQIIDQMAAHKLNHLHWHLTDDQGWRIEIKHFPELTRIGAWRTPPTGRPKRYGGFYTQDQIRALVAYAAARHIVIVPEIDFPGHAQAAVAAYPQFGVTGRRVAVSTDWGVNPTLFNTDDRTLAFLETVLDEVMDLFPSPFIHLGGDEAIKDQWQQSKAIQAQMRRLGITDENALQSWFMERLGRYLADHGRRMMGWDEILDGGVPPSASVMSWRGVKGAIDAARLGHDVVQSPAPTLYFDSLQSRRGDEPAGRLSIETLADVYRYEPLPPELDADQARHLLGVQANLWSEYLITSWHVEHALFPRLDALAEIGWTPPSGRNWNDFLARLAPQMSRYRHLGIASADSAFAVDYAIEGGANQALDQKRAVVTLSDQASFGEIRYRLDGGSPDAGSPLYQTPLTLSLPATVMAASFDQEGQPLAAPRRLVLDRDALLSRDSAALDACPKGAMGLRVPPFPDAEAPLPALDVNLFDDCWVYRQARLDGVSKISLSVHGLPRNYGLAHEADKVIGHPDGSAHGHLDVHLDACEGPKIASFALSGKTGPVGFSASLPRTEGAHDLCLLFTGPLEGPLYAIDKVGLR